MDDGRRTAGGREGTERAGSVEDRYALYWVVMIRCRYARVAEDGMCGQVVKWYKM